MSDKFRLKGICVSAGFSTGQAVICNDSAALNITKEQPIILVVQKLDRDIVACLKENVVGVVSEKGSIGSHGAGLLREFRIPCIVRIENACKLLDNDDIVEIDGVNEAVYVYCGSSAKNMTSNNDALLNTLYSELANDRSETIRLSDTEDCYRPERSYQLLRYDIIKPAWENSPQFLFGLDKCEIRRNDNGVVFINRGPKILDICSYVIAHPNWFYDMSRKRTREIIEYRKILCSLSCHVNSCELPKLKSVFLSFMELYRGLFQYIYLSQYISDELLEIFIDLVRVLEPSEKIRYISLLESDYVSTCIKTGVDPGISQVWKFPSIEPFVWEGDIKYIPFSSKKYSTEPKKNEQMLKDYWSLLKIVPLVYQMSEEFFYTSSSINSFINRSLENIGDIFVDAKILLAKDDVYKMSLENLLHSIDVLIKPIQTNQRRFCDES